MKITLDLAPGLIGCGHDPGASRAHLLLDAPAVGDVARGGIEEAVFGSVMGVPFEPAHLAGSGHEAIDEAPCLRSPLHGLDCLARPLDILGMDEVEDRAREKLLAGVAKSALERRI